MFSVALRPQRPYGVLPVLGTGSLLDFHKTKLLNLVYSSYIWALNNENSSYITLLVQPMKIVCILLYLCDPWSGSVLHTSRSGQLITESERSPHSSVAAGQRSVKPTRRLPEALTVQVDGKRAVGTD